MHSQYGTAVRKADFELFLRENNLWGDQLFPWEQGNHEPSPSIETLVKRGQTYRKRLFNEFTQNVKTINKPLFVMKDTLMGTQKSLFFVKFIINKQKQPLQIIKKTAMVRIVVVRKRSKTLQKKLNAMRKAAFLNKFVK